MDAIAVAVAALAAGAITAGEAPGAALPTLIAFVLLGLNVRGSYHAGGARRDAQRIATGVLIGGGLAALTTSTMDPAVLVSREFLLLFSVTAILALIGERGVMDLLVRHAYRKGIGLRRALIVARTLELKDVLDSIGLRNFERAAEDQVVVGHVTPEPAEKGRALGTLLDLEGILDSQDISELVVATSLRQDTMAEVADMCFERGVRMLVIPRALRAYGGWAEPTRVGRLPAYHLHPARLELPALLLKRASDLVFATVGLALSAPLILLIAACIKLDSRGPVFFRQRRVGLGGREFMMWKFRSMLLEAETKHAELAHLNPYGTARLFKVRDDPRVTRVGRVLRRLSLDELPQLFNILRGDMSLVGPRPPVPSEVRHYEPRHMVRLSVVPGLTGPWQVSGRNLITDFEEVVRLERSYIENWSLRSDISIIVRTVAAVLSGKGAY